MFLRLFKTYNVYVLVLLSFLAFVLWFNTFFLLETPAPVDKKHMLFYELLLNFDFFHGFLLKILGFIIIVANGFILSRINTEFIFIKIRTYLPSVIYIFIICSLLPLQYFSPALPGSLAIIYAFNRYFQTYKSEKLSFRYFEASFVLALGSLFYAQTIYFLFISWVCLAILRPFYWREWLFTILGFLSPYFFVFTFLYVFKNDPLYIFYQLRDCLLFTPETYKFNVIEYIYLGYIGLLILVSSVFLIQLIRKKKIHSRKFFTVFFWFFLLSLVVYFLLPSGIDMFFFIAVPSIYVIAHFFALMKKTGVGNILFVILILLIILLQLNYYEIISINS